MAGGGLAAPVNGAGGVVFEAKITPIVIISCIMAATGGLMFGYDVGISGLLSLFIWPWCLHNFYSPSTLELVGSSIIPWREGIPKCFPICKDSKFTLNKKMYKLCFFKRFFIYIFRSLLKGKRDMRCLLIVFKPFSFMHNY